MDMFSKLTKSDAPIAFNYMYISVGVGAFLFGVLFGWNGLIVLGILYLVLEHFKGKAHVRNGDDSSNYCTVSV